jgi:hypothetical protein
VNNITTSAFGGDIKFRGMFIEFQDLSSGAMAMST